MNIPRRAGIWTVLCLLTVAALGCATTVCGLASAPHPDAPALPAAAPGRYDIGTPTLADIWVDPLHGDDSRSGTSRSAALASVSAAWERIPAGVTLTDTGYRILLAAGDYPETSFPLYWEDRHGTSQLPILLQAADGPRTVTFHGFLNVYNVDYFYLVDVDAVNQGDVFHCDQCDHVLLRNVRFDGGDQQAHEVVKANQSQYLYIEDSDLAGTYENDVDYVAVQYGHIVGSRLHNAGDWCAYVKGGSAYINVEGNTFYDCGTGGFSAGQGTGFEYMTSPWLHYEAYAIRVVNNVIHDTDGAGLGVNGGYQVLMAYNTLYRVGARSHVIEVVHGLRSCDGATTACAERQVQGGWGPTTHAEQSIPDRSVYIYNNLVLNPPGYQSQWQHFAIAPPRTPDSGANIPTPTRTDDDLRIAGNVIWNGPSGHPLGIDGGEVCIDANPTCNAGQLNTANAINAVQPQLVDPAHGDFRLADAAGLPAPWALPAFPAWASFMPTVPASIVTTAVTVDFGGSTRLGRDAVGAFVADAPAPGTATPEATPGATESVFLPAVAAGEVPVAPTSIPTGTPSPAPTATATPSPTPTPTLTPTASPVVVPTLAPGAITIVTLGDSLTAGDGDDAPAAGGYPRRLLERLAAGHPGSTLLNLGASGWTSGDLIDGTGGQPGQLGQAVTHLQNAAGAKLALVWIGSNDLWYLYEYGPSPMADEAETEARQGYTTHMEQIVAGLQGTGALVVIGLLDDQALRPVVANPPNPAEPAFPSISAADRTRMSALVGEFNSTLATVATNHGARTADFFHTTIFTDPATLAPDGNHPNGAGYDAIADIWFEAIAP